MPQLLPHFRRAAPSARVLFPVWIALLLVGGSRTTVAQPAPPQPTQPPPPTQPFPSSPTLSGSLGLLHTSTAEVGRKHQLRLGLHGQYFGADDFLIVGDSNQRLAGGLVAGYTFRSNIEFFGALLNSSNRNRRPRQPGDTDPELIKTFGDLVLGGKWIVPLSTAATLGLEAGVKFLSGVTELAVSPSSTSWWLGPLFTFDLRRAGGTRLPLRFHVAASFFADNSRNLRDLSAVTRATKEVATFAYGIAPSRLRMALALDAPLDRLFPRTPLVPFLEYHAGYVTSDADPDFQAYRTPNCDDEDPGKQPCVENRDMHVVTVGARAAVHGALTLGLALDIRIRSPGFPYGSPLPPYNVTFGVSYPFDLDALIRAGGASATSQAARGEAAPALAGTHPTPPVPTQGHIGGTVRSARDGSPVTGAVVAVAGRLRARAATDPDGGFVIWNLPAGPAALEVSAAGFAPTAVSTVVTAGAASVLAIDLVPLPAEPGEGGASQGAEPFPGDVGVPAGPVEKHLDEDGLLPVEPGAGGLTGRGGATGGTSGDASGVTVKGDQLMLGNPIRFVGATAKLTPSAEEALNGVANFLLSQPQPRRLRVVAHWDSSLPRARALELTRAQAEAVRAHLVSRGLQEGHVSAAGEGGTRPLVPNLTPANRARNRRVELRLVD